MKKTGLLYIILFFSTFVSAQDACAELTEFNKKNIKRAYRLTSTSAKMGITTIVEQTKDELIHQTMNMEYMGIKQKIETIITGSAMYIKREDNDWKEQTTDSLQRATLKNQWQNNQMQYYKNCKKLDDVVIEGKTYHVYTTEFDKDKIKETMDKVSPEAKMAAEMLSQSEMKMTFYINQKGDIEKTTLSMSMMGQSFDTETMFEYDVPISITVPTVKKGKN